MQIISTITDPNQSFNFSVEGNFYTIAIKETNGVMSADLSRNNVQILSGSRIVSGYPIIPYLYLEDKSGNFAITTDNENYPYYTDFGVTQYLAYLTPSEMEEIRAGQN